VLRSSLWRAVDNSAAYLVDRLQPGLAVLDDGWFAVAHGEIIAAVP